MSLVLLLLGVVTTAAGFALVASGASVREGALENDIITPGTIAAVGGLLLIGLGLAVRELQRIEQALAGRLPLLSARPGDAAVTADAAAVAPAPRIPFPPKPKINPQPEPQPPAAETAASAPAVQPSVVTEPSLTPPPSPAAAAPAATTLTSSQDGAFERLRAKFPTLARLEGSAGGPEVVVPPPPVAAEANVGEVKKTATVAGARANGPASERVAPRFDTKPRPASPDRTKASVFNAFWPATPRRDARTAPGQVATPAAPPPSEPAAVPAAAQDSAPAPVDAAAPISALKSGMVEGMAYTLYSDGSIEAQLPQGKLRFSSIAALRSHIERSA